MMRTRVTLAVVVALTCVGVAAVPTSAGMAAQPEAQASLDDHMNGMHESIRTIARYHNDASKRDDVLRAITQLQEHTLASKSLDPHKLEKLSGDELESARDDYRARMSMLLGMTTELEIAYLDGEHDKVDDIIRNKFISIRNKGHQDFQEDH
ncbi:MAG: hypothetical protein ACIAQ0_10935 [Phycisphaerales bacterium JB058]